jgi:hypothetical protein
LPTSIEALSKDFHTYVIPTRRYPGKPAKGLTENQIAQSK